MADSIDAILREANKFLGKRHVVDDAQDYADSQAAANRAQDSQRPLAVAERYGKPIKDAAEASLIPLSLASNPLGMAAGGVLLAKEAKNFIDDPSVMGGALTALGALPFVKGAKALTGGAKKAVVGAVDRYMPNRSGSSAVTKAQEIPKPSGVPYQRPTEYNPALESLERFGANKPNPNAGAVGDDAADLVTPSVERFAPNRPNPMAGAVGDDAAELLQPSIDRFAPNVSNPNAGAALADEAVPQIEDLVERYMPNRPASLDALAGVDEVVDAGPVVRAPELPDAYPGPSAYEEDFITHLDGTSPLDDIVGAAPPHYTPSSKMAKIAELDSVPEYEFRAGQPSNYEEFLDPAYRDAGAVPESLQALTDWRQIPPTPGGKANFVKQHVGKSQQELVQELGERDYGFREKGAHIKQIKKPIYPEGNSKTDKLVAAIRQREKLMGKKD
jgi:hypothetical protein